jgi:thiamine pyrophosphate-dependent acetolactate synthase large subunit-like protein
MVNQWQVLVDSEEVSQVQMISPDFEKVADAYSIGTHSFSNMAEIDKGLESAISQK